MSGIEYEGFSVLDIWGICPGRYTKRNKINIQTIDAALAALPPVHGAVSDNTRPEYGKAFRQAAAALPPAKVPVRIPASCQPLKMTRQEVVLLGSAGQRIITAGEMALPGSACLQVR
jgi:2-oxoglutarate ferredoxin oxidoreductase subunit beta